MMTGTSTIPVALLSLSPSRSCPKRNRSTLTAKSSVQDKPARPVPQQKPCLANKEEETVLKCIGYCRLFPASPFSLHGSRILISHTAAIQHRPEGKGAVYEVRSMGYVIHMLNSNEARGVETKVLLKKRGIDAQTPKENARFTMSK